MEGKNTNWSLNELYSSFDSDEFRKDFAEITGKAAELASLAERASQETSAEPIKNYILFITTFYEKAMRVCDYCQLTLATDADNAEALKYLEKTESTLTETSVPETKFKLSLKRLSDEELNVIIASNGVLGEHAFFLREAKEEAKHTLSEAEENIISKMENTGSGAWEKFQENVMATLAAEVEVKGERKRLPFAEIRSLAYDKSAETRKAAYVAELEACKSVAKACAAALNGIKGEALTVSKLRGYDSPLQMTVLDSRLDMEVLDALISAIRQNLCIFQPYFRKKAERLGIESKKLPFYDLFAPAGDADFRFSYEEAVDFVSENLSGFSPELGEYVRRAADSGWLDVYPREGKRGGAFCQNLHYLKQSRFLLNFKGSFNDMLTIAHELGHGFHGECLKDEAFLNSDYPMPIAETASTLCETIVVNAALKNAPPEKAVAILENGISGSAQVIVDILSRFIFESKLFELRKEGSVPTGELCALMLEAQKEAYGDGLDFNFPHEYMWVVKSHYYSAAFNFYNFPYAFGMLLSNGLYTLFEQNGQPFAEVYRRMLASTGKANLADAAQIAGINIRDEGFWNLAFEPVKRDIEKFCCY